MREKVAWRWIFYYLYALKVKITMRYNRLFFFALFVGMLVASCSDPQSVHIKMVCTTDVHGNYFSYDYLAEKPLSGGLAHVSSYLNEVRSTYGENVVYLDNGDILHGQPTAYCYNTSAIQPRHLAAEVLDYLGCDAVTLGNHEIETGGQTYQRYIRDLSCPALGGNIYFEDSDRPFLYPYTIVEREGVKIAVMGMTTPAIPDRYPRTLWQGLEFRDIETTVSHWMEYLREEESPDLVVGLFHSGLEGGIVNSEYVENATRSVAENVPGFDAIFYGHVHKAACDKVVNVEGDTVLLINPANNADKVATLDIQFVKGITPKIVLDAQIVDVTAYTPDTAYINHFAPQRERVTNYVNKKLGVFTVPMDSREAFFGSSAFVDFLHRMQLDVSKAEVSLVAPSEYDMSFPAGDVYVRDMFSLYRYENTLCVMQLTGSEIKNHLEMSYGQWVNTMKSHADHLLLFDEESLAGGTPRLKNHYYNFDSAAGILYEVDVTKPQGSRIRIEGMADGTAFDPNRVYRVAVNSYRSNGGGDLLAEGTGIPKSELANRILYSTTADMRFYALSFLEMRGTMEPKVLQHWKFIPERWTKPAAARDYELLFGTKQ